MKALAYHGVLYVLEKEKILPQVERVAGSSAGSLISTLLSFYTSVDEIVEIYQSVDYKKLAGVRSDFLPETEKASKGRINQEVTRILDGVDALYRFLHSYGWYENDYPYEWLQEIIANYCNGNGEATFEDFRILGYRDLHIVVTNISKHNLTIFSADTTPEVSVADAVMMSSSLPFFYEAVQFDGKNIGSGDFYGDGGLLANYPLHVFDDPKYSIDNKNFVYGINWETLGCRLYTPEECIKEIKPINGLFHYIQNLLETVGEVQDRAYESSITDILRTINVSNYGVSPTDTSIRPEQNDMRYKDMVTAAERAANDYLQNYSLPTDRLYDVKARFAEYLEEWQQSFPHWKRWETYKDSQEN